MDSFTRYQFRAMLGEEREFLVMWINSLERSIQRENGQNADAERYIPQATGRLRPIDNSIAQHDWTDLGGQG